MTGWVCAAALLLATAMPAAGQDAQRSFQLGTFESLPGQGRNILNVSMSQLPRHLELSVGVLAHHADDPLTLVDDTDRDVVLARPVDFRFVSDVSLAVGLFDRLSLGVVIPLAWRQRGDDLRHLGRAGESVGGISVGDPRLVPKVLLLGSGGPFGWGAHLYVPVHLPLGDADSFLGDDDPQVTPSIGIDWRHAAGFELGLNVGYRLRGRRLVHNLVVDDALEWAAGLRMATAEALTLVASVYGSVAFDESRDPEDFGRAATERIGSPIEVIGGLELRLFGGLVISAGAGGSLARGVGAADLRLFLGVAWTREPRPELQAAAEREAEPPVQPEADAGPAPEADAGPAPEADAGPAGQAAAEPQPESVPDRDGDAIPDASDHCPDRPESPNGLHDADGCPDTTATNVRMTLRSIALLEKMTFITDSMAVRPRDHAILDGVATALAENDYVTLVRIEGHTDSDGPEAHNLRLTQGRADAVRRHLIRLGVDPGRLIAQGFGESRPIATNTTLEGRVANRRIEFIIVETRAGSPSLPAGVKGR